MKILVCGSRHWTKYTSIERALSRLAPGDIVVHGAHFAFGKSDMRRKAEAARIRMESFSL
jgi:hypothetical protein